MLLPSIVKKRLRLEDGKVFWIFVRSRPDLIGKEAGHVGTEKGGKRYWSVQLDGKAYQRSRIVYCLIHGEWPANEIDHRDGNSLNDHPSNLRQATRSQNMRNVRGWLKASSCPPGVRETRYGKFDARICIEQKSIQLGTFADMRSASAAYQAARKQYFGEFA